jgi:crossover junction endodeoxyribonuclease RuvC
MKVLGIDPGFASIGYSVVDVLEDRLAVISMGVIRTEKSSKKTGIRASDDNLNRAKEISRELATLIDHHHITVICAETMSYPRNASAAAKMAMCWGVLATLADRYNLPITQASPQEIKKAVCGKKDASKEEVQEAVRTMFPVTAEGVTKQGCPYILREVPRSLWEHPFDALAAVVACRESEVLLLARRMAGHARSEQGVHSG